MSIIFAYLVAVPGQARPRANLPEDQLQALTERIQDAGTEVVKAKVCSLHADAASAFYSGYNTLINNELCCTSAAAAAVAQQDKIKSALATEGAAHLAFCRLAKAQQHCQWHTRQPSLQSRACWPWMGVQALWNVPMWSRT